jgi:histidine kinase/DNA gyrase B/HSP90-like ATPase
VGETRVELLHLLEDLRDAYPGSLEETIVSEIVANSLDSRAAMVVLTADPGGRTLCVVDDGSGMTRGELRRYHSRRAARPAAAASGSRASASSWACSLAKTC